MQLFLYCPRGTICLIGLDICLKPYWKESGRWDQFAGVLSAFSLNTSRLHMFGEDNNHLSSSNSSVGSTHRSNALTLTTAAVAVWKGPVTSLCIGKQWQQHTTPRRVHCALFLPPDSARFVFSICVYACVSLHCSFCFVVVDFDFRHRTRHEPFYHHHHHLNISAEYHLFVCVLLVPLASPVCSIFHSNSN